MPLSAQDYANYTILTPNTARRVSFGVGQDGKVVAVKYYILRFTNEGAAHVPNLAEKASVVLDHPNLPKYGDALYTGATIAPPSSYTYSNPIVISIEAGMVNEGNPIDWAITVNYGWLNEPSGTGIPSTEDNGGIADVDRERYPWEQSPTVSLNYGGSLTETALVGQFLGVMTAAAVGAQRKNGPFTPTAEGGGSVREKAFVNTAGDFISDVPSIPVPSAQLTIDFCCLSNDPWKNYADAVNSALTVNMDSVSLKAQKNTIVQFPAGTLFFLGVNTTTGSHTQTFTWKKGKRHPWDSAAGVNMYGRDLSVSRFFSYIKYSLAFEYRKTGFICYFANRGMRKRIKGSDGKPKIVRCTTNTDTTIPVSEPVWLNSTGDQEPVTPDGQVETHWHMKYAIYEYKAISSMLQSIPNPTAN